VFVLCESERERERARARNERGFRDRYKLLLSVVASSWKEQVS